MITIPHVLRNEDSGPPWSDPRKGGFMILALVCLVGCLMFVVLSVDVGYLTHQKTKMQNGVDAAALAAAQEITHAVQSAPVGTADVSAYALAQARQAAQDVAAMNNVYVDKDLDVRFGMRAYNAATGLFETTWNTSSANVVEVTARRSGDDPEADDGKLTLFFAGVTGDKYAKVEAKAVAYVEARDMVVIHDFSRSMNFDSYFNSDSIANLTTAQITANLGLVWSDLQLSAGTLSAAPQYLTLSSTNNGVTTSAKFKYNVAEVTSSGGTVTAIQLRYTDNSTYNAPSLTGSPIVVNGSKDINRITVTTSYTTPAAPETITVSGGTIEFSADRKSVAISTPGRLQEMYVRFTDGTSYTKTWSSSGPYSYTYSSSKAINYIDLDWYGVGETRFDCSPAGPTTNSQTQQFDDTNSNVISFLGLSGTSYPYPVGSWDAFVSYARSNSGVISGGLREVYSGLTFAHYVLENQASNSRTPKLSVTRHYPFHAVKRGHEIFCTFLNDLKFDDHIGMVSYDDSHRIETTVSGDGLPSVNIASKPITNDYAAVNNLMKYKQAGHYSYSTNMGGGLKRGIELMDNHKRNGARPTLLLMTDGNANNWDSGENGNLPSGWSWNSYFDYDGDGSADYSTNDSYKRNVLKWAKVAYDKGYTIHTIGVGSSADNDLLAAVAHMGGGHHIAVPGNMTTAEFEELMQDAFHTIAAYVPPPKLMPAE